MWQYLDLNICSSTVKRSLKTLVARITHHFSEKRRGNMSQEVKTYEKKLKIAEQKIHKILNKIESLNLKSSYVTKLDVPGNNNCVIKFLLNYKWSILIGLLAILVVAGWSLLDWNASRYCLLSVPSSLTPLLRAPEDCSMCSSVRAAVRLANTSAEEFEQYAYSATPVIVTDATKDWRAVEEFSFNFFAKFYRNGKMGTQVNNCFFFAYKSGLNSLQEVFEMSESRANLTGEPWYVGWSTCYDEEMRKLREYYRRPYFLPRNAESDIVDWIFMGGPGQGAHMHVDSVRHMSWQAQTRGRKRWALAPPPECLYRCTALEFTVHPGEILVVDTNRWYHKTEVLPGDISITIGAEYD